VNAHSNTVMCTAVLALLVSFILKH